MGRIRWLATPWLSAPVAGSVGAVGMCRVFPRENFGEVETVAVPAATDAIGMARAVLHLPVVTRLASAISWSSVRARSCSRRTSSATPLACSSRCALPTSTPEG